MSSRRQGGKYSQKTLEIDKKLYNMSIVSDAVSRMAIFIGQDLIYMCL